MRTLTLEEAATVTDSARGDGDRPDFFNAQTDSEEEISQDFEAYLILTPISVRSNVSSFFQVILDNDPNQIDVRNTLINEYLEEEKRNELDAQRMYQQLTSYYDQVRSDLSSSIEGFEDVQEATLLQEAMTRSMGDIVAARDRHVFNYAALSVLSTRQETGGSADFTEELRAWVRVLVEYD
jgi:hypothetical protein